MIGSFLILLQGGSGSPQMINILFIVGMVLVFYFFMIRPQQRKQKKQKEFTESIKKGDLVVTVGGMHGRISAVEGNTVLLEVDKGVKVRMDKTSLSVENSALLNPQEQK